MPEAVVELVGIPPEQIKDSDVLIQLRTDLICGGADPSSPESFPRLVGEPKRMSEGMTTIRHQLLGRIDVSFVQFLVGYGINGQS